MEALIVNTNFRLWTKVFTWLTWASLALACQEDRGDCPIESLQAAKPAEVRLDSAISLPVAAGGELPVEGTYDLLHAVQYPRIAERLGGFADGKPFSSRLRFRKGEVDLDLEGFRGTFSLTRRGAQLRLRGQCPPQIVGFDQSISFSNSGENFTIIAGDEVLMYRRSPASIKSLSTHQHQGEQDTHEEQES